MMAERYYNFKLGLNSKPKLLTLEEIQKLKINENQDAYLSIYYYNEEQKRTAEKNGSVASISNVVTDTLVFDFDSKDNPEKAKADTLELGRRLVEEYNVDPDVIFCYYSGKKGYHVAVPLDKEITPEQFKQATVTLSNGLETFDASVSDHARILRMEHTKHQDTGLYKIPLHLAELEELSVEQIRTMSKKDRSESEAGLKAGSAMLPERLFKVAEKKKETQVESLTSDVLDFSKKPRGVQDYVYAILEGHYESGERHNALMVLAAKYRSLGYDKDSTYYICKSSLKKQAQRTGQDEFDKEELWDNIIEKSVFSDTWEGGSYSPKNSPWLAKFCERHKIKWDNVTDANVTSISEAFDTFENFALNIDKNTIKTGIKDLDDNLRLTIGMSAGLVASPGVGKTSVSLQMLNNMSKQGHRSIFFSYDMYAPIVYQKLVQKHFGLGPNTIFKKMKEDPKFRDLVKEKIKQEYDKTSFCFKTGQTVPDIISTIKDVEDLHGEKVKFIVMDYNELIITGINDPTQSSAFVAQKMREIAQSMDMCVFSLFQPSKMSGTPADEIRSYNSAKGSGAIAQSVSVMLGMSRPGYNPQEPENDRYVNIACLKNRMGPLFGLDFSWDGLSGTISSMTEEQRDDLRRLREKIESEKETGDTSWS